MYYVCIENNKVISILDYKPNVPKSIIVKKITDAENEIIENNKGYYDIDKNEVVNYPKAGIDKEEMSKKALRYLNSTDWKVLRHIRETQLGVKTTLSNEEYVALETKRQKYAALVI